MIMSEVSGVIDVAFFALCACNLGLPIHRGGIRIQYLQNDIIHANF